MSMIRIMAAGLLLLTDMVTLRGTEIMEGMVVVIMPSMVAMQDMVTMTLGTAITMSTIRIMTAGMLIMTDMVTMKGTATTQETATMLVGMRATKVKVHMIAMAATARGKDIINFGRVSYLATS